MQTQDGWLLQTDLAGSAKLCFNSLPEEEGIALAKQLTKHSSVSFGNGLTYARYKDVPVSWFFCEDDMCITPEVQQVKPI
jgi:hypothetical protein